MNNDSPMKPGWRGHLQGCVKGTNTICEVGVINLALDRVTAHALCNLLTDAAIERAAAVEGPQVEAMSNLGAAIGRLLDHSAANNGGRQVIK